MMLETADGAFVSGSEIARQLGLTRAAVWKCICQLKEDGWEIEAVRNRGYRLGDRNDTVSEYRIRKYLESGKSRSETDAGGDMDSVPLAVRQSVTSTNDVLKSMVQELPDWYTLVAETQTKGKGRRTRSFFSPAASGLYLSMLVRLPVPAEEATRITTIAAVAACRAISECTDAQPGIKWVNDVYINGKKVCGILTEASISMESGGLDWAVMGIGFNVYEPEEGFPEELAQIAGSICKERKKDLRCALAASFIRHFRQMCEELLNPMIVQEYRELSIMKNRPVTVIRGEGNLPAIAEEIDDVCRLVVRYQDGSREVLSSGEVSIRMESSC